MRTRSRVLRPLIAACVIVACPLIATNRARAQTNSDAPAPAADPGAAGTPDPAATPPADVNPTVEKPLIVAQYPAMDSAFNSKDVDTLLDQTHAPEFKALDKSGKSLDFQGVHDALIDLFGNAKTIKEKSRVRSVTFRSNTATVEIQRHVELTIVDPITGETSQIVLDNSIRDFWTKDPDTWSMLRSRLISSTRRITGKPPTLHIATW